MFSTLISLAKKCLLVAKAVVFWFVFDVMHVEQLAMRVTDASK